MDSTQEHGKMDDLTLDAPSGTQERIIADSDDDDNESLKDAENEGNGTVQEEDPTMTRSTVDDHVSIQEDGAVATRSEVSEAPENGAPSDNPVADVSRDEQNASLKVPESVDHGVGGLTLMDSTVAEEDSKENGEINQLRSPMNGDESMSKQKETSMGGESHLSTEAKRLNAVNARNASLKATLAELDAEKNSLLEKFSAISHKGAKNSEDGGNQLTSEQADASLTAAKAVTKEHISLLHRYNEMRDIGLGMMGIIADQRGVRLRDVQEEFGVDAKD
ncbi:hypothetical protein NA57DRAFT_79799 [Rhizodiscina lignyota]|uniref:Swi5-domain-containing protein n=1 Tax=Rhizodiscina lignyota TaxID=1504668 RepID=A0A9P4M345_9PEZI|nr:hypothetical protein NA57DRAFT_79799 [Rhizodiscina lignyota]